MQIIDIDRNQELMQQRNNFNSKTKILAFSPEWKPTTVRESDQTKVKECRPKGHRSSATKNWNGSFQNND